MMGDLMTFLLGVALFTFPGLPGEGLPALSIAPPPAELQHFEPLITAPSALITDVAGGGTTWAENQYAQRPIASLTKLMTALIILENHPLSESVGVPRAAAEIEGTSAHLFAGEEFTVGDLLKALLISSGNDAALTLAIFHSGSEAEFVTAMNRRALVLGMNATHFVNAHGLDAPEHYSTAHDLAILARKVLEFPFARSIVSTRAITITSTDGKFSHPLETTNDLLFSPFPIFGMKTGTTDEAGQCLIALAKTGKGEVLLIVLGSTNRFQDVKALLFPFL